MQLCQILTGSCNVNKQCLSIGTVSSHIFITYGSGNDLVILNHDFVRQQIVSGHINNNSQIISVSCTFVTGKILVLFCDNVCVYEPSLKVSEEILIGIDQYLWEFHSTIKMDNKFVKDLCWIPIFTDFIILVGRNLQVWKYDTDKPQFYVANKRKENKWTCIWNKLSPGNTDIDMIKFSSDGKYFATLTFESKDILIWFWDQCSHSYFNKNCESNGYSELFDYLIIKHPSPIISFEWRSINHIVPRDSINNSLLTCSLDNVCRIWTESHLNQYKKLLNLSDLSFIKKDDTKVSDFVKNIFFNYIKEKEWKNPLTTSNIIEDFKYFTHDDPNYVYTYPEFVLSANINDATDIPLFTTLNSGKYNESKLHFVVHWLNNKDFNFIHQLERGLNYFSSNISSQDLDDSSNNDISDKLFQFNRYLLTSINKWKTACDVLFAIHPENGSLLVWLVHNLDESGGHLYDNKSLVINKSVYIKNAQVTVHSCLPNCIPIADAMSMSSNILLYCEEIQSKIFERNNYNINYENSVNYEVKMISKQQNGSLNMWCLNVSNEESGDSSFLNIKHISRISGHRWQTNSAACHLNLPFLLTISNFHEKKLSELILWRIKPIGPFSKSGGITEIARINSENFLSFTKVAWFPGAVPNYLFAIDMSSPASFFIATDFQNCLSLYISIADAKNILKHDHSTKGNILHSLHKEGTHFHILSLTSTGEPGCILSASFLETVKQDDQDVNIQKVNTLLLHVFPKLMIMNNLQFHTDNKCSADEIVSRGKYSEIYFIVKLIVKTSHENKTESFLEMWKIHITEIDKKENLETLDDLIHFRILNEKVYSKALNLPQDIFVLKAVPAASHLSSASIYPNCLAPYLITTMCSDGSIRFWRCSTNMIDSNYEYEWIEWQMQLQQKFSSTIFLSQSNTPLEISCAYSGRVAVAYANNDPKKISNSSSIDISVDIYECESTGGSEWILEDNIKFTNTDSLLQSSSLNNNENLAMKSEAACFSTLSSMNNRSSIQIDWINSEDGTHLLSIVVGTKIMIYTPACLDICKYSRFTSETSSLANFTHWKKVNEITLKTADLLPPIPEHISWAREGLLIVGLDNEVHVYNQWNNEINNYSDVNSAKDKESTNRFSNLIKQTTKTNYSLARLKDAYFFNENFRKSMSKINYKGVETENNPDSEEILLNASLFEAAQVHNSILPQYHSKQLMEWINFGKIKRVKSILSHLTRCISNESSKISKYTDGFKKLQVDENLIEMSQLEIKAIPPLPLYVLLEQDFDDNKESKKINIESISDIDNQDSIDFTSLDQEVSQVELKLNNNSEFKDHPWLMSSDFRDLSIFGPEEARRLSECLTRLQLPGLTALDQIYLLGIAELMCNLKTNISEARPKINKDKTTDSEDSVFNLNDQQISTNSMDDCGLRFLLAMQHFSYMIRTLPLNQRNTLMIQGIDTSCIIWGFHSETEEELCTRLDEITLHNMMWVDFRRFGCGWWIRNNNTLQRIIEKVAKNTFQKSKNPMDSAIFYLALGKQKLVAKLFKNCNQTALYTFFDLDFSIPENKNRALNQAYKLRSKRRYDHAVALFLLCHSIDDAILMCLHNMKDIQLAITITRLYDMNASRNSKYLNSIIKDHVIQSSDPFIRSMGYWILEDYGKSLDSLLIEPSAIAKTNDLSITDSLPCSTDTIVFVFYFFLKKHPIILRKNMITNQTNDPNKSWKTNSCITPMERRLYFRTAYTYLKMGCPDLALEVLSKLPEYILSTNTEESSNDNSKINTKTEETTNGIFDWNLDDPQSDDINFQIKFDEDDKENKELNCDDEIITQNKLTNEVPDIMCLQYKFMICLKLISEELCTLATGIETHGSYLRYHLYSWLEKEVKVLQNMCGYSLNLKESKSESCMEKMSVSGKLLFSDKNDYQFSIADKILLRKRWLKANQSLILSLYSFCSLHGHNIAGLAAIRMELLILIQEIQGSSCIQYDPCKYPHSSFNLPFVNSSLSPDNGLIITPVQHLKTFIHEIVDCLNSFKCPFPFLYHHSKRCHKNSNCEISENKSKIKFLRDHCQALSACLHQCLSNFTGMENDDNSFSYVKRGRPRQSSTSVIYTPESDIHLRSKYLSESNISENVTPNSDPVKWPGFTNLFKVIGSKPQKDMTIFSHLLAEALVVIYSGILIYAMQLNDTNLLYRLIILEFNKNFWGKVFGGTLRQKPERPSGPPSAASGVNKDSPKIMKDNITSSALQDTAPYNRHSRLSPTFMSKSAQIDEKFVPPLYPILTCLLEKPLLNPKSPEFIYDSDCDNLDEANISIMEDEESSDCESINSKSYTWSLLRLVILHSCQLEIKKLTKMLQVETGELAIFCPHIFSVLNCLVRWQNQCKTNLHEVMSIPDSYSTYLDNLDKLSKVDSFAIRKYMANQENIPFKSHNSISLAMKRLWYNLIKKPELQPMFIQQFLFLKNNEKEKNANHKQDSASNDLNTDLGGFRSIRIIHKEHDCLHSMALNQIDKSLLVTSTSKEVIELSIHNLINPEQWFDDECEYLKNAMESEKTVKPTNRSNEKPVSNDFLLISPVFGSSINYPSQNFTDSSNVILKRPINGIQILRSHPTLPYYLTGNSNGQVGVFEWGIDSPVVKTYSPIQKGKITSLNFDTSGNKFGMGDSEGNFSLFHFSYADNSRAQYFQTRCPHKGVLDFCFLNSSSVVATCGGSALYGISSVNHLHAVSGGISNFDNNCINVSIWDVLLPSGRNQVRNLSDVQLSAGVITMCYSSRYELLIAGTRKGEIAIIDIRQNAIQNIFQAHDMSITSIKLDPLQYYFVTSACDGQIKIWRLLSQELIETFRNEPIKTSVFSRDIAIKSLSILDDNKIISCSADGFIKLRYMEPKYLCNNITNDLVIL